MGQGCSDAAVVQATPSDDSDTDYGAVLGYRPDAPPIVPEAPAATGNDSTDAGSGTDDGSATTTDPSAGDTVVVAKPNGGPTGLSLAAVSGQMALSWNDGSSNEDGFAIRRYTSAEGWIDLADVAADSTSYTDSGVQAGMTYCYDVAAFNAGGDMHTAVRCLTAVAAPSSGGGTAPPPAPPPSGDVQISGIVHADGRPMAGVVVRAGSATPAVTDTAGRYSVTVSAGWSGEVTAHWDDALFNPPVQGVTNALVSLSGIDFAAYAPAPSGQAYYVGSNGTTSNDGSRARPWPTVEHALSQTGGGATILVKPGYYQQIRIPAWASGTPAQPTVIKAEIKWTAVVNGPSTHGIFSPEDEPANRLHDVVVDGFTVDGGNYEQISYDGLHFYEDSRIVVRNCRVSYCNHMGVALHFCRDSVIERNWLDHNGRPPSNQYHGVYTSGERLVVQRNIVQHSAGFGLHLYPEIADSYVAQNLVVGHPHRGIITACPPGGGRNWIVNNTVVGNDVGICIWAGNGEVVANNLLLDNRVQLLYERDSINVYSDYSLLNPIGPGAGPHGFVANPGFVDAANGTYWITPLSSAVGRANPAYAPETDFWERPISGAPSIGAFGSVTSLVDPANLAVYDWWMVPIE